MPIPIFFYDRYRFINTDADTNMIKTDTDISVSANQYIVLSLYAAYEITIFKLGALLQPTFNSMIDNMFD